MAWNYKAMLDSHSEAVKRTFERQREQLEADRAHARSIAGAGPQPAKVYPVIVSHGGSVLTIYVASYALAAEIVEQLRGTNLDTRRVAWRQPGSLDGATVYQDADAAVMDILSFFD